jgi:hypothetical protein
MAADPEHDPAACTPLAPVARQGLRRLFPERLLWRLALLGMPKGPPESSRDVEHRFIARCREFAAPSVLEMGTKQSIPGRSTMHRDWVPHASEFLGTDIQPGADVDIIADAHRLSDVVGRERFDIILSGSVFEHLKYPTLAAHEVMKSLKVGGAFFIHSHQTFFLHGYPSDYFRFSREAMASLFGTEMGVEIIETNYQYPVHLYTRRTPGMQFAPAFVNTTIWGEKRAPTPEDYRYEL